MSSCSGSSSTLVVLEPELPGPLVPDETAPDEVVPDEVVPDTTAAASSEPGPQAQRSTEESTNGRTNRECCADRFRFARHSCGYGPPL